MRQVVSVSTLRFAALALIAVAAACSKDEAPPIAAAGCPAGQRQVGDACVVGCGPNEVPVGDACVACGTGQARFADRCVTASGTAHLPAAGTTAAVVDLGDTHAQIIIPPGALAAPIDIQWSVRALTADQQAVDGRTVLPEELEFAPVGTAFSAPIVLALPLTWPTGYEAMATGSRTLWVPSYSRSSGVLSRDTLSTMSGDGGVGWVILDASVAPRRATALVPLDHFSSHTITIPAPDLEWGGQAAFTKMTVAGATQPLLVPTGVFAHGLWDQFVLGGAAGRAARYLSELKELARQTTPARAALWSGYDDVFTKVADQLGQVADLTSLSKQLTALKASYEFEASLAGSGTPASNRLLALSSGFKEIGDTLGPLATSLDAMGKGVELAHCLTDGLLQTFVLLTIDDDLVQKRWAAMKDKLGQSPLGKGDPALQDAIAQVDKLVGKAGPAYLTQLLSSLDSLAGGVTVPACTDFAVKTVSGVAAAAIVSAVVGTAGAPAVIAAAVTEKLVSDWLTKDNFLAAQNGERIAILASLLSYGELGSLPELGPKLLATDSSGAVSVTVPDVLDAQDPSSAPYLRLSAAVYAQSQMFATFASVAPCVRVVVLPIDRLVADDRAA